MGFRRRAWRSPESPLNSICDLHFMEIDQQTERHVKELHVEQRKMPPLPLLSPVQLFRVGVGHSERNSRCCLCGQNFETNRMKNDGKAGENLQQRKSQT